VPERVLPKIVGSAEIVGRTSGVAFLPDGLPIAGIAGDQQAALFGQACFAEGDAKCTYGTGAFALVNIGDRPLLSDHGLVTTAAWRVGDRMTYALEGSAFIAGAAVQWLRDGLGIIKRAKDIEELAGKVASSDGVVFVPALAGLGAPHWDQDARGSITGLTRGTTAAHLARATLEGIAFEVRDLLDAMAQDAGRPLRRLRVDGGAAANDLLMQMQADFADVVVERPGDVESTGRGAAMLAAMGSGVKASLEEVAHMAAGGGGGGAGGGAPGAGSIRRFEPSMPRQERAAHLSRWTEALTRTRSASRARPSNG
jgi:glycerol kinase